MTAALLRSPVFWFRAVSLLVVVSLALGVARLTWRLVGWDDGREAVWTPAALAPVGGATGGDLASILAWAPFGGGAANASGLPISNLGIVLKGVVYVSGGDSTALISSGEGPVQIFAVGQTPIGSAMIEAIEMDRVVLNVGGRREALLLPNPAGVATGGAAPEAAPMAAPASGAQGAPATAPAPPSEPPATPSPSQSSPTAESLGVAASLQGYVVGPDSAPQLLNAGLRTGDVIKSLNGQALGDPARDRQTFQRAAAAGSAQVEVLRDGRTLTLTVPLR